MEVEILEEEPTVLISMESALLGLAADLAVGPGGELAVIDVRSPRIHVMQPGREGARTIASEGQGPGELLRPSGAWFLGSDTLAVVDGGNGRIQLLDLEGRDLGTRSLPTLPGVAPILGPEGELIQPTHGFDSILAVIYEPDGSVRARIGEVLAPVRNLLVLSELRAEVAAGGVPGIFMNTAVPAVDSAGGIWLALPGAGRIQRYWPDGQLELDVQLEHDGFEAARREFVRANSEDNGSPGITPLRYIRRIRPVGDALWILLDSGLDHPVALQVLGPDGDVRRRLEVSAVRGAGDFAVDTRRGVLYLVVPDRAEVVSLRLPDHATGPGSR